MKTFSRLGIGAFTLVLLGQGCFGGGGSAPSVGGVWQTTDAGGEWTQLSALPQSSGVGSIAGVSVRAIEIDPTDTSAYYIGTEANGMLYSYDHATSWQRPENEDVRNGMVLDIEVDPRDVCTIYVLKPKEILKSTDCNRTFDDIYVETRGNAAISRMALDWFNPDILWAGTTEGDIMKSEDGGRNWRTLARVGSDITSIIVSNADSRVVLVGTNNRGIIRTTDGGANWTELEDQLSDFRKSDTVYSFTQTRNGSSIIANTEYGLLKSIDQGATWTGLPLITPPGEVRIWSVAINPKDEDVIYYATQGTFYQSTTGGDSWVTEDLPSGWAPRAMAVHPDNTNTVLLGFFAIEN